MAAIEENWRVESAANPALYDGEMLLQGEVDMSDGAIHSVAHFVPFSTFLLWRRMRLFGYHLFGLPIIVSSDGAIIAIRMAEHTANPGKVYCAAGSLDFHDVRDGHCDLGANMAREVAEETGLDLSQARTGAGYHALVLERLIPVFKVFRFEQNAQQLLANIDRHIHAQAVSEIDGAVAIRDSIPGRHPYAPFMPFVLDWFFNRGGR